MKKITYISFAAIAAVMGLSGCSKEVAPDENPSSGQSFTIYTEITKTVNDDMNTKWAAGDAINVFHASAGSSSYSGNSKFSISEEGLSSGIFTTSSLSGELSASNDWYALYPYNSAIATPAGNDDGTIVIGSETAQYQSEENPMAHLAGTGCPLFAQSKGIAKEGQVSLAFKPAVSVVKLHVVNMTGETQTINSVSVTASEPISGQFTVNFTGSEPSFTAVSGKSSKTAYLKFNTAVELSSGNSTDFYIVVKPFTNAAGTELKFSVNAFTKTSTEAVTFSRGSIKTVNFGYDKEQAEIVKSPALPTGVICNNTTPVFSPDCETVYFVTRGASTCTKRYLYSVNLSDGSINWNYDLTNATKAWYANGGNICVNPNNGDVICSNQCDLFVIKSDGTLRWSKANLGAVAATNTASLMIGCGPAMSNDNSVIFVPYMKGIYALNAETGDEINHLAFDYTLSRIQMAVYGNNNIVFHTYMNGKTASAIKFINFNSAGITIYKTYDAEIPDLSDISCAAVTLDQSKVYFFGRKTGSPAYGQISCFDLDSQSLSSTDNFSSHGAGYRWTGAISENGMLAHASTYNGTSAAIGVINANNDLSSTNFTAAYLYPGGNASLNFEGVAFDREGSIYFFVYDSNKKLDTSAANNFFLKTYFDGVGYQTETIAKTPVSAGGTYQGAFAFGGHYLVAIQGSPAVVHICRIDEERAHSWGNGGNACHTNNANQIAE